MNLERAKRTTVDYVEHTVRVEDVTYHLRVKYGKVHFTQQYDMMFHSHYFGELQYVYQGGMVFHTEDGREYAVRTGEMVYIPAELIHSVHQEDTVRLHMKFRLERTKGVETGESSAYCHLVARSAEIQDIRVVSDPAIRMYMDRLRVLDRQTDVYSRHEMQSLLAIIVQRFFGACRQEQMDMVDPEGKVWSQNREWIIKQYISVNYYDNEGLGGLARQLHLSTRQAGVVVQKLMGENYKALVTRQRLRMAIAMLHNTDISLVDIAREVGYESYSGFYTAFRKYCGRTPEEERRSQTKTQV